MLLYEKLSNEDSLIKKYILWRSERDRWLKYAKECMEIFYNDVEGTNTIFTAEQLNKIKSQWDIPISINKIYPAASHEIAILSKSKPSFKIAAYDERGKNYAVILDKIIKHVLYSSDAVLEEQEVIKDTIITGMGIAGIEYLFEHEVGKLPFKYKRIDPDYIILDPNSRERDLSDLTGYFIEKELTKEQAQKYYQKLIDAVNQKYSINLTIDELAQSSISSINKVIDFDQRVRILEYYDKVYTNMYFVEDPNTGDIIRLFAENLEEDQSFLLDTAIDMELNLFVRRKLIIGDYLLYEEILPITKFPIAVKFFEWAGRIYKSYGLVHFVKDMQEALTKFIQLTLVNGMLTNNAGWIAPIGSIRPEDRIKWETMGNKPGVIKEYLPQIVDGQLLRPEKEQIQNLSQFYPFMIEMMVNGIDIVTGINQAVRGEPNPNTEVFSTLKALQEAATYRIEMAMTNIIVPNRNIGEALIQYVLSELKANTKYILIDSNDVYEVNTSEMLLKDFRLAKYLVVPIPSEALPTKRLAQATEMFKIAQTTTDPYLRDLLVAESIKLSDIGNTDELYEKMDVAKKATEQAQQSEEIISRLKELNKQLENRIIRAEIDNKVLQEMIRSMNKGEAINTSSENPATEKTTIEKLVGK